MLQGETLRYGSKEDTAGHPPSQRNETELSSEAPICADSGANSVLGGGIDRDGEIVLLRF